MNKILLIVEGENREVTFFTRYKNVKKMNDNLEVVPFKQNILELYRLCKSYIFNGIKPNNIVDIMLDASNISDADKDLLQNKFTDVYLVFDLDIQNALKEENIDEYLNEIKELIDFFDDSTSIGQLLINYPSMDSIYHISDPNFISYKDICIPSDIETNKNYKTYLDLIQITYNCTNLTQNDFQMLAAINLLKSNFLVTGKYEIPTSNTYGYELTQKAIFEKQTDNINRNHMIYVLNSSLFIDVDLFGRSLYFHQRGIRLFNEEELKEILKHY